MHLLSVSIFSKFKSLLKMILQYSTVSITVGVDCFRVVTTYSDLKLHFESD